MQSHSLPLLNRKPTIKNYFYIKTSGSESRPRKVELASANKKTRRLPQVKASGSESRPRKVELASANKKTDDYRKYFTHNNEACKNPYKTTLPHLYIH